MSASSPYPEVNPRADFPAIERAILDRWSRDKTFEASIENRSAVSEFVFYDGPPFANGLPHHGHLLTGYVKDVIPRYQTMRGNRVERRFGWDCHGLPAEMETEKDLGVAGRAAITEYGIAEFNAQCRSSVLRYTSEWEETVTRQARWVDFENDYRTMDLPYMESVMWAFNQLWEKGLIYEDYKVMPYSWGAETPLSNFEIRLDDATRPRQDPAVTVGFDLVADPGDPGPMRALAWTTTPWTLPSNLALAVGPDVEYNIVEVDGVFLIIGAEAIGRYSAELSDIEPHSSIMGRDLVGRSYVPLFEYFADRADAFTVVGADFVDAADGTGIVHMAPGFGEDDQVVCEANGIAIGGVVPVNESGQFTDVVVEWAGQNVFEANPGIIANLKGRGLVFRHETYEHNYPHCWRTDTPIIYRAINSWYVDVTAIRDRLQELNQEMKWVPEHIRDGRFGMWLEGARDWSISRNRFWGSPVPVWKSDDENFPRLDVYGSLDEIEADFGVRPDDLHRPYIDELTRPNPDDPSGKATMRRVPEVLDCWFESGSMPFAQVHYPFENREWFEEHFPADFIVEYINQTRGWFYTMHVLAGALFDRPAAKNVICHGVLLASDGSKLSKRLRNYTEPNDIFDKQGSDALRWYFLSTNIVRGGNTRISDQAIDDVVRQVLIPIWNAYSFFTLYANADGYEARTRTDSTNVLDRYVLAKARTLIENTTTAMDSYDLPGAASEIHSFIDALNNWYIRRSRDRFWGTETDGHGDRDAYDTLYTVLSIFCRVAAPFLPMLTEHIYGGLSRNESVHLTDWPDPVSLPDDPELIRDMDRVRDVASTALRLREDLGIRVRQPLQAATVAGKGANELARLGDLLKDEINVKTLNLTNNVGSHARFVLKPNAKLLGPRLGKAVQQVLADAREGSWVASDGGSVEVAGEVLAAEEYELKIQTTEDHAGAIAALRSNDAVVVLDTEVTDVLRAEGTARDIIRQIQQLRKTRGLQVTDRIAVELIAPGQLSKLILSHRESIMAAVLAVDLDIVTATRLETETSTIDDQQLVVGLRVTGGDDDGV